MCRTPAEGAQAVQHAARPLVDQRVPFVLSRQAIDAVERGALDSDWAALKDAARKIAFAEDRSVFDGYAAAGASAGRDARLWALREAGTEPLEPFASRRGRAVILMRV